MGDSRKQLLLIVDDEAHVREALCRLLKPRFARIRAVSSAAEAQEVFRTEQVTHLLCDHWLGKGSPTGLELVESWRRNYPSIQRAVLITGTNPSIHADPMLVDAVLSKLAQPQMLFDALSSSDERMIQ